jgi:hypothetical protein
MKRIHAMNSIVLMSTVCEHMFTFWTMSTRHQPIGMISHWLFSSLWVGYKWLRHFANIGKVILFGIMIIFKCV